jgi:methylglutaconyl-CoA hydratase
MSSTVILEKKDEISTITLNRLEKRNALNERLIEELGNAFSISEIDENISGVIITGAGDVFCSGADLQYLKSLQKKKYDEHLSDTKRLKDLYYKIYTYPKPTVAVVNGPAIAGGCGLMNVCDFAFASKSAQFGYPEAKIGFIAALVSVFLIQTIGLNKTKEMLFTGDLIDANTAERIGLINKIIEPEGNLMSYAINFLRKINHNSRYSIHYTKRLITSFNQKSLEKMLNEACIFNAKSRLTADFSEGIQSFLEKRKPIWGEKP